MSNLSTTGGSVPSGRSARIVLTLSRTSCIPTSPFFDRRNCTVTIETPSVVTDRSSSIPETVLMMSSIGLVTVVSIVSTLAPGRTVVTVQTGKSTSGKRSTPSSPYETSPSTTGIATSTQVKTGRLMQMSDMVILVWEGRTGCPGDECRIDRMSRLEQAPVDLERSRQGRQAFDCHCQTRLSWLRTMTAVPSASCVCPVVTTSAAAGKLAADDFDPARPSTPVLTSPMARALPCSTRKILVTPA